MSDVTDAQGHRLDQVRLFGVSATGYHGVFEHERREGQTFVVDVVVHLDTRRAAARDDLAHTLDYGALAQQVVAVIEGPPADLIETVAERIAATVLADGAVSAVDVAVHKPQAPITVPFGDVVVAIRRDRSKLPAAEPYRPQTPQRVVTRPSAPTPTAALPLAVDEAAAPGPTSADTPSVVPAPPLAAPVEPPFGALVGPLGGAAVAPPLVPLPPPGDVVTGGPFGGAAAVHAVGTPAVGTPADERTADETAPDDGAADGASAAPAPVAPAAAGPDDTAATQVMSPLDLAALDALDGRGPDEDVVEGELETDVLDSAPTSPVDVVLALGANLGNAQETLRQAVGDLDRTPGVDVVDVSPLARTAPVGGPEQPDFLNAVILVRTTLSPRDLLRVTQSVELGHGRERHEHWGPRTLDIDIVVYGSVLAVTDDLELPHPRAHERAFVLQPWAQVDPSAVLPGLGGGPVAALAATAPDKEGIRWLALDWLTAPVPAAQWDVEAPGEVPPPGPTPSDAPYSSGYPPVPGH